MPAYLDGKKKKKEVSRLRFSMALLKPSLQAGAEMVLNG